jgi:hypothetical protein
MDQTDRLYKSIVLDVIENIREDFKRVGVNEELLLELQKIWESKLVVATIPSGVVEDIVKRPILGRPEPTLPVKKSKMDQIDGQEDEELDSEDDDKVDDTMDTTNILLSQHEKMSKTKNRWKFKLVGGFVKMNGKDALFHDGICELEW